MHVQATPGCERGRIPDFLAVAKHDRGSSHTNEVTVRILAAKGDYSTTNTRLFLSPPLSLSPSLTSCISSSCVTGIGSKGWAWANGIFGSAADKYAQLLEVGIN